MFVPSDELMELKVEQEFKALNLQDIFDQSHNPDLMEFANELFELTHKHIHSLEDSKKLHLALVGMGLSGLAAARDFERRERAKQS